MGGFGCSKNRAILRIVELFLEHCHPNDRQEIRIAPDLLYSSIPSKRWVSGIVDLLSQRYQLKIRTALFFNNISQPLSLAPNLIYFFLSQTQQQRRATKMKNLTTLFPDLRVCEQRLSESTTILSSRCNKEQIEIYFARFADFVKV